MQTEPIYALYVDYSNNSDCGKVLVSLSNTSTDRHTKLKLALKHTVCGSQTHAKPLIGIILALCTELLYTGLITNMSTQNIEKQLSTYSDVITLPPSQITHDISQEYEQ